jgi:hypothetical protein
VLILLAAHDVARFHKENALSPIVDVWQIYHDADRAEPYRAALEEILLYSILGTMI